MLATLPTLDDSGLAPRQMGGDPNRGIQIPGTTGDLGQTGATRSDLSAKGKQAMAGSSAPSGPSPGRSSSGAPSVEVSRRRSHRSDRTLVTDPTTKRQRATEDAGQGSSRAPGSRGTPGVAAPPPPPTDRASPRQQQQQPPPPSPPQGQQQQPRGAPPPPPSEQKERSPHRTAPSTQQRTAPPPTPAPQQQEQQRLQDDLVPPPPP